MSPGLKKLKVLQDLVEHRPNQYDPDAEWNRDMLIGYNPKRNLEPKYTWLQDIGPEYSNYVSPKGKT